jgi:5-methylcytosine-specific restriction protein A
MTRDTPDEWDRIRRNVYRRDQYTCQNCGAEGGPHGNTELHAHHIVPKKYNGVDAVALTLA